MNKTDIKEQTTDIKELVRQNRIDEESVFSKFIANVSVLYLAMPFRSVFSLNRVGDDLQDTFINILDLYLVKPFDLVLSILSDVKSNFIEINIDKEFSDFTDEDLKEFYRVLENEVGIKSKIEIFLIEDGSVKLTIKLKKTEIEKVLTFFKKGGFEKLNLEEIIIESDFPEEKKDKLEEIEKRVEKIQKELISNIGDNKIKETIDFLLDNLKSNEDKSKTIVLLKAGFNSLVSQHRRGSLTFQEFERQQSIIRKSLFDIIDEIEYQELKKGANG